VNIAGNASPEIKKFVEILPAKFSSSEGRKSEGFAYTISTSMILSEVSVLRNPEEPSKWKGRVVWDLTVSPDMLNSEGTVNGGCLAFLIDQCASMPNIALGVALEGSARYRVTQSLDIVHHSPAVLGDKLRLVSTTIDNTDETMSARTEIWNSSKQRLVASGVLMQMYPSLATEPQWKA